MSYIESVELREKPELIEELDLTFVKLGFVSLEAATNSFPAKNSSITEEFLYVT